MKDEELTSTVGPVQKEVELIYQNNRELFYSYDSENNCYTRRVDYQYEANQLIVKQSWDALEERVEEIRQKVISGKISPLAYFMEKSQMDAGMLARYSGIKKWRIKRHLRPDRFLKISRKDLMKYAMALDISLETITDGKPFIKVN